MDKEMTMAQQILARRSGRERVEPGEAVAVPVDLVFAHDGTAPLLIDVLEDMGLSIPAPEERRHEVYFVIDHAAPSPRTGMSKLHKAMREFARRNSLRLYDVGWGISHVLFPYEGKVRPWMVIMGADSHTLTMGALGAFATGAGSTDVAIAAVFGETWMKVPESIMVKLEGGPLPRGVMAKDVALEMVGQLGPGGANYMAVEFAGPGLRHISMEGRFTLSNMTVESGAKTGLAPADIVAQAWLRERGVEAGFPPLEPGPEGSYRDFLPIELDRMEPLVAAPPLPNNVKHIAEVEGTEVDQVFIGTCVNGRLEDMVAAARVLKGRRVREGTRCIVIPGSRHVFLEAGRMGIIQQLVEAGCVVGAPSCGPCIGGHYGLLGPEEVAVFTSNRNMPGRSGDPTSRVYLASPLTAAAAAVEGRIVDPRGYL